jgi:hypothetical protein
MAGPSRSSTNSCRGLGPSRPEFASQLERRSYSNQGSSAGVTLADERARQRGTQTSTYTGAPVLDPTAAISLLDLRASTPASARTASLPRHVRRGLRDPRESYPQRRPGLAVLTFTDGSSCRHNVRGFEQIVRVRQPPPGAIEEGREDLAAFQTIRTPVLFVKTLNGKRRRIAPQLRHRRGGH